MGDAFHFCFIQYHLIIFFIVLLYWVNKYVMKYTTSVIICCFLFSKVFAQHSVNAGGKNEVSASGSISYSIGQVNYKFSENSSGSLAEGVQHPYEVFVLYVNETTKIDIEVYPNPTTQYLSIKIPFITAGFDYKIYDLGSKLLKRGAISDSDTIIDIAEFASSSYILDIQKNNKSIKTYKIIKIDN